MNAVKVRCKLRLQWKEDSRGIIVEDFSWENNQSIVLEEEFALSEINHARYWRAELLF